MKGCLKALTGLMLVFIVHLPRFLYQLLLLSYAYVFNNQENLTADPKVHLKRARKLLKGQNSQLLYAAIEVRFALERMTYRELSMTEKVSNNERKEYSPVKHIKSLRRIDDNTQYPHKIFLINKSTGERIEWGKYKPLEQNQVKQIQGRLGDLLHPKQGLRLGISNDPWYIETRTFLTDSINYLEKVLKENTPFFAFEGLDHIEMIREET
jgi:hypothetical protein